MRSARTGPALAVPALDVRAAALTLTTAAAVLVVAAKAPPRVATLAIAALAGAALVAWAARHTSAALAAVIVIVPTQQTLLAWAYASGAPAALVRNAGFAKEALVAGLVLAVLRDAHARRRKPDLVEVAGVAFLAVATLYFVLPTLVPGTLGGQSSYVRLSAWRINCLFVVLALACRRLTWTARDHARLLSALLAVGGILAVGGLYEVVDQSGYDRFLTDTVQQPRFVAEVLQGVVQQGTVLVYGNSGGSDYVRVGGWEIDALTLGFSLVLPLTVGLFKLAQSWRQGWVVLATGGMAFVLLQTLTRSAILAGALAAAGVAAVSLHGRQRRSVTLLLTLVLSLALALPFLPGTSLADRITGAKNGTDSSANEHESRSSEALTTTLQHPLGFGLGSNPGTGAQLKSSNGQAASENYYLQVSLELGWAGLLAFVTLVVATLRALWRRALAAPGSIAVPAAAAMLGLSVGAYFLHVWLDFQTSLLVWGFLGVALSTSATGQQDDEHERAA